MTYSYEAEEPDPDEKHQAPHWVPHEEKPKDRPCSRRAYFAFMIFTFCNEILAGFRLPPEVTLKMRLDLPDWDILFRTHVAGPG